MSTTNDQERALKLRELGNDAVRKHDYKTAIEFYSKALEIVQQKEILSNRSFAYIQLHKASEAIKDADAAIALDPSWWKPHYRKGVAHEMLGEIEKAKASLKEATSLNTDSVNPARELLVKLETPKVSSKATIPLRTKKKFKGSEGDSQLETLQAQLAQMAQQLESLKSGTGQGKRSASGDCDEEVSHHVKRIKSETNSSTSTTSVQASPVAKAWNSIYQPTTPAQPNIFEEVSYPLETELVTRLKGATSLAIQPPISLNFKNGFNRIFKFDGVGGTADLQQALAYSTAQYLGATFVKVDASQTLKIMTDELVGRKEALKTLLDQLRQLNHPAIIFCPDQGEAFMQFDESLELLREEVTRSDSKTLFFFGYGDFQDEDEDLLDISPEALGLEGSLVIERDGKRVKAEFPQKYRKKLLEIIKADPQLLKIAKNSPGRELMSALSRSDKAMNVVQEAITEIVKSRLESSPTSEASSTLDDSTMAIEGPESPSSSLLQEVENRTETIEIQPPSKPALLSLWQKKIKDDVESRRKEANEKLSCVVADRIGITILKAETLTHSSRQIHAIYSTSYLKEDDIERVFMEALRHRAAKAVQDLKSVDEESLLFGLKYVLDIKEDPTKTKHSSEELSSLASNQYEESIATNIIDAADIGVLWNDVGGLAETKELLKETTIYPLKYPQLYQEGSAAEAPKGLLLFGPPGTGKTMLAKAVASETGATFLSIDSASIGNKWYGESEKYAKAVFTLARKLAPCVIFIDEIDSLLSSRDDSERSTIASVKTTLMREWDGLGTTNDRVLVIGATNRPFSLDEAILRRMPRRILVDLPSADEREAILKVALKNDRINEDFNVSDFAKQLEDYSGSDIRELCREAAVRISHDQARKLEETKAEDVTPEMTKLRPINKSDFEKAKQKIKPSVHKDSPVLAKVKEWNEQYGETGKNKGGKPWAAMYS